VTGNDAKPPRNGEGDRAKRGGGGSQPTQRPVVYRARSLRREMSLPERVLWQALRQRPEGLKFRRQHPIGPYIVDFYCSSARLSVEVDGKIRDMGDGPSRDVEPTKFLKENGNRVLRVSAQRVLADAVGTAEAIAARAVSPHHRPADGPPPPYRGGLMDFISILSIPRILPHRGRGTAAKRWWRGCRQARGSGWYAPSARPSACHLPWWGRT
jgi:very-short-patch-repair endonuclease